MKIKGEFNIKNGNTNKNVKNKFVDRGILGILFPLVCRHDGTNRHGYARNYNIRVGSNTDTSTGREMESLIDTIGGTQNETDINVTQDGDNYTIKYTATWESGSLSGTLGEVGIFLYLPDDRLHASYTSRSPTYNSSSHMGDTDTMFSRICEADGDFTSFVIDEEEPLSVEYKLTLTYDP